MSAAVTHAALAQKPPVRTLVPTTTYTSTPGQAKFEASVLSRLHVPPGYHISVFAQGLGAPRIIAVGDDGTVYVTRRDSNDVIALRGDGTGAPRQVVKNLPNVHGITLHDGRMYLATVKEIYVSDMRTDGTVSDPRQIVTDLPDGGQHPNRTLGFGPDGMLYVSIGSTCNLCIETNEENATILRMMADGTERGIFARGLRNTIGWGWHPDTKELWGMDHGSDSKGNDIPPEELNRIQSSTNYGWPFCYGDKVPDKYFSNEPKGSSKDEMCPRTAAPVLSFVAHSAPIQMAFYTGTQFPSDVRGDAFVAMRGSWNRQPPSGYKLVRIHFENGKPVRFDDFATGFITPDGNTYVARLAGVAMAMDGSLLLGDDTNGVIYRISYGGSASAQVPAARAVDTMRVAAPRDTMPLPPMPQARANRVAFIDSLKEPESVLYDADQDVYFISNIDGPSAAKDGKGFISRVPAGGGVKSLRWIESGRNGAMLNAPKGMSINGDTLWVSDLDVMRAFNRKTGAPIASLDLSGQGAAFLNDVVTGADGNVYITDSEVAFDVKGNSMHPRADRVFRVDGRRAVTIALETDRLMRPNGIAWDKAGSRFTIVSWGGDSVFTWKPGTSSVEFLVAGPGQFDGAAFTGDGTLLVSSKATSSIYALRGGKLAPVVQHVSDVADIGIDTRRKLLLVPLTSGNKVEVYQLP
ncbi:MAG: glucose sorbosone dehydrogenase [Gemmatimonadetes bacterium]|nr:glucose sorbosone dehydrogenase [Gemmatimonadota bacterium]